jgi:xanthine dehydrogenase molybdopterin-binding subunit B
VPQIEVTFDIDANGILHVGAKDLGTGKEQKITITASSGLSKDEVEKMRKDAEAHADDDKAKLEEIQTRNEADNAVYRTEKCSRTTRTNFRGRQGQARSRRRGEGSAQRHGRRRHQIREREAERSVAGRLDRTRPPPRATLQGRRAEAAKAKAIDAEVVDEKKARPAARKAW